MALRSDKKTEKKPKEKKTRERKPKKEKAPRSSAKGLKRGKKNAAAENPGIVFESSAPETVPAFEAAFMAEGDGFRAGVRSAEPVLSVDDSAARAGWKNDLLLNISGSFLLMAFMSLFCMATWYYEYIPFLIPGALLFLVLTTAESIKPGKLKWIVSAVIAVLLIAAFVVFRAKIGGGLAELVNLFYDEAEDAQAYLYKRLPGGDGGSAKLGAVWISCLIGLIASLPPARFRRDALIIITVIAMFAFAYYGLIPSAICIAVMLAALLIALPKGSFLSSLPLVLAVMLIFGAIVLIDPGEFYGISRIDENFRDRFALNSRLIEGSDTGTEDFSDPEALNDPQFDDTIDNETKPDAIPRKYIGIAAAILIVAALAAAVFLLWRRFSKKRKALRKGIDSSDPRTAVTAMFPYAIRWLRAGGIETASRPFCELTPLVAGEFSQNYADRYREMYLLWREAAYSDHKIDDTARHSMEGFLKDTAEMIKDKLSFTDRLRAKLKYSL